MLITLSIIFTLYSILIIIKLSYLKSNIIKNYETLVISFLGTIYFILLISNYKIYGISIILFASSKYLNLIHPKSSLYLLLIANLSVILIYVLQFY